MLMGRTSSIVPETALEADEAGLEKPYKHGRHSTTAWDLPDKEPEEPREESTENSKGALTMMSESMAQG